MQIIEAPKRCFDIALDADNKEQPITFKLKDTKFSLSADEAVEFFGQLYDYQDYFYEARIGALRMAGKVDEAISLIRRTDIGNKISYSGEGPTQLDLFHSYFLNKCSEEWLAEQLDIPLTKVKEIWEVWNDDFQERTPETAQKLEAALKEVMGPDVYEKAVERTRSEEECYEALMERRKLWGLDAAPLHLVKEGREVNE